MKNLYQKLYYLIQHEQFIGEGKRNGHFLIKMLKFMFQVLCFELAKDKWLYICYFSKKQNIIKSVVETLLSHEVLKRIWESIAIPKWVFREN